MLRMAAMMVYRVQEQITQPARAADGNVANLGSKEPGKPEFVEWILEADPDLEHDENPMRVGDDGTKMPFRNKKKLIRLGKGGIDFVYENDGFGASYTQAG